MLAHLTLTEMPHGLVLFLAGLLAGMVISTVLHKVRAS